MLSKVTRRWVPTCRASDSVDGRAVDATAAPVCQFVLAEVWPALWGGHHRCMPHADRWREPQECRRPSAEPSYSKALAEAK